MTCIRMELGEPMIQAEEDLWRSQALSSPLT